MVSRAFLPCSFQLPWQLSVLFVNQFFFSENKRICKIWLNSFSVTRGNVTYFGNLILALTAVIYVDQSVSFFVLFSENKRMSFKTRLNKNLA